MTTLKNKETLFYPLLNILWIKNDTLIKQYNVT